MMNDIPRALFEVGEIAILCSARNPHLNGEVKILDRDFDTKNIVGSEEFRSGWHYALTIESPNNAKWWAESALRKRPKPGDSFDKLMGDLKRPVNAGKIA